MTDETVTNDDTLGAESQEIETVTDTDEPGEPPTEDTNPETGKLYTQKELDEQFAKIRKAEERKWQKRLDRELERIRPPEPEIKLEPPNESDYATIAEYTRALARHEIALQKQQETLQKSVESTNKEVKSMISEASGLAGYDHDTIAPYLVEWGESDAFADTLLESPYRAQILEYLSMNDEELEKVDGMSHARRTAWIGKMESRFEKKPNSPADQKPRVGGGNVSTGYDIKSSSSLDHTRQRAKEGAAWAIRALAERRS
jgi:hypothetical protein